MSDPRNIIQEMFAESHRYANFGNILMKMHVKGFRCHTDTIIEFSSPITAFCGLNGTGKSTLLQLAATAYKSPDNNQQKNYYIRDFIVVGTLDPNPFTTHASVEFKYWQANRSLKPLTISRNSITIRWQGYPRRIARHVFFTGVGIYLPKIEMRDAVIRNANHVTITSSYVVSEQIKQSISKILGCSYDSVTCNTVNCYGKTQTVTSVQKSGTEYSEVHMGYGEGRTQHLVTMLETLPEKSLILIEEPETSLHPSAQYEFGNYLIDVVRRKRHQILLTTHSEFILQALPSSSRIYLNKRNDAIDTIIGLTALQAKSLMTQGHVKALHILVEDPTGEAILCEIVRRVDPDFLRSVGVYPAGSSEVIGRTVRTLQSTNLPVAAVRDGDKGASPGDNIFKLPGTLPPEKELFACNAVREFIQQTYGLNLNDFETGLTGVDHHQWFNRLSEFIHQENNALLREVARIYARSLPEVEALNLTTLLKEASRQ